jgi:heme a synthase
METVVLQVPDTPFNQLPMPLSSGMSRVRGTGRELKRMTDRMRRTEDERDLRPTFRIYRWTARAAVLLALAVILLGATVRLSDAGLSCPDWPGCYGQLTVSAAAARPDLVQASWPDDPLDPGRAHLEMLHRYAAGALGLLILVVAFSARHRGSARVAVSGLVALLILQVLLGMWTVTLRLEPLVVVAHLIGGMTILGLLWWLVLEDATAASPAPSEAAADRTGHGAGQRQGAGTGATALKIAALIGLGLVLAQIALGGWTAVNHAALACRGFPTCNGAWWPPADFAAGFSFPGGGGGEGTFDAPTGAGLIAIHWAHRLGALVLAVVLGALVLAGRRAPSPIRRAGFAVGTLLTIQVGLGIANVLAGIPLPLAVAHNGVAAVLLLAVLTFNHRLARAGPSPENRHERTARGEPSAVGLQP